MNRANRPLLVTLAVAVTVVVAQPARGAPTQTVCSGTAWTIVPDAAGAGLLHGVADAAPDDVWAVGESGTAALVERWTGTSWSVVPISNLPAGFSRLQAVDVVSGTDAWTVGDQGGPPHTLAVHWDGTDWTVMASPNPGPDIDLLLGVSAVSANDVWAVGYYNTGSPSFVYRPLILHWNGTAWSVVSNPSPPFNAYLYGVSAVSSTDVWAVGERETTSGAKTLIEHWNGTNWTVVPSPNGTQPTNRLFAVSVTASTPGWAVGDRSTTTGSSSPGLIEGWNGSTWLLYPTPSSGFYTLFDVSALSGTFAWAVGDIGTSPNLDTLTIRWNGTAWGLEASPNGSGDNTFEGVATVSTTEAWAVGFRTDELGNYPLIEHFC